MEGIVVLNNVMWNNPELHLILVLIFFNDTGVVPRTSQSLRYY
jgi:hypothetical protein